MTPYLHGKVFRRSVIEKAGISFNEKMSMGEDSLFIKQYLSAMKQGFVQSEDVAYFYTRDNENSLSRKYYDNIEYCYSEIYDALEEMEKQYPNFQVNSGKKKMIATMVIQNLYADSCNLSRRQRIATISRYMSDLETNQEMTEYVLSRMDLIRKVLFQINNPWLLDAVFSMGKKVSKKIKKS